MAIAKKRGRVFYGWWVVAAASTLSWYGGGVWFYGFSVVFEAFLREFGWSRAVASGAFSLSRLEGGLEGPLVGWLIDRIGPRTMALFGAVVLGIGYILIAKMSAVWMLYVLFGGVIAVGFNTGFSFAGSTAVANWFVKKRGRALGLYTLGGGLGGATIAPLIGWLINLYGWRTTVVISGVAAWVICLPLALALRHKPEQYGLLPDGDAAVESPSPKTGAVTNTPFVEAAAEAPAGEVDFTWREALRTVTFWLLVIAAGTRSMAMTSVLLHQVTYLTDIGISRVAAATALGLMVAISLPGRLGFGWLGDRYDKRWVLIVTYILQAVGVLLLANVKNIEQVYLFVVIFGLGYGGAIPVYFAMRGEMFGRKHFATIGGFLQLFLMPATMIGPVFAGWVYDTTGSYYNAFMLFILLYIIGAAVIPFIRRPGIKGGDRPDMPVR